MRCGNTVWMAVLTGVLAMFPAKRGGAADAAAAETTGAGSPAETAKAPVNAPLIAFSSPLVTWVGPASRKIEYGFKREEPPRMVVIEDVFPVELTLPSGDKRTMHVRVHMIGRPTAPYPAQTQAEIEAKIAEDKRQFRIEYVYNGLMRVDGALVRGHVFDAVGKKDDTSSVSYMGHVRGRYYSVYAQFTPGAIPLDLVREVVESTRLPDTVGDDMVRLFDRFESIAVSEAGFLTNFGRLPKYRAHKFRLEYVGRIWYPDMPQAQRGDYYLIEYVLPDSTISVSAGCVPMGPLGRDALESMIFEWPVVTHRELKTATELTHGQLRHFDYRRATLYRSPITQQAWTMMRDGVLYLISADKTPAKKDIAAFQAMLDSPDLRCRPLADVAAEASQTAGMVVR